MIHPQSNVCSLTVRLFANSPALVIDGDPDLGLAWLAGLLEAEGTFIAPTPSAPRFPIVACQMTDRDVVERVASMFGTTVNAIPRGGVRRTLHVTRIKGSRAALLMGEIAPAMGERRSLAIAAALNRYSPPSRKLGFEAAEQIRDLHALGASVSWLARSFEVARSTIRQVIAGEICFSPPVLSWRATQVADSGPRGASTTGISVVELFWLAGWLEGEGSFVAPPPSDPRRARIMGTTRDADVAAEVGRLLDVSPHFSHNARERRMGWSPTWRLLRRGRRAVDLMHGLYPLMGSRRQAQIESALAAVG